MKKFFSASSLSLSDIKFIITSSINPGSTVLSTITRELGWSNCESCFATFANAE